MNGQHFYFPLLYLQNKKLVQENEGASYVLSTQALSRK